MTFKMRRGHATVRKVQPSTINESNGKKSSMQKMRMTVIALQVAIMAPTNTISPTELMMAYDARPNGGK